MKKVWLIFLVLLCSNSVLLAQTRSMRDLVGKWEIVDSDGSRGLLEAADSTAIYLAYGGERKRIATYKADFSRSPGSFQFVIKDSAETITLNSQLLFVNADLVEWRIVEGSGAPQVAAGKETILYLRRKK